MATVTANLCTLALILLSSLALAVDVGAQTDSYNLNYPVPQYPPGPRPPDGDAGTRASATNDPHFVGAHGTRYDFNGLPGEDYCLFTDSSAQINMHVIGYYDERTIGASVIKDGKAVRTWIGKLGIMWKVEGESHSLVLSAREGPQVDRGSGFLASAELDSVVLPALQEGESHALGGGATLTFKEVSSTGVFPQDVYTVTVPGLFTIGVSLRVAHPLLRTPTDAMTHFNVVLEEAHPTDMVHGLMGQTFRKSRASRAMDYSAMGSLLRRSIAADGPSGEGFLDGSTADYQTSSVSAADCRFSAFNQAE